MHVCRWIELDYAVSYMDVSMQAGPQLLPFVASNLPNKQGCYADCGPYCPQPH